MTKESIAHQEIARIGLPGFVDSLGAGFLISAPASLGRRVERHTVIPFGENMGCSFNSNHLIRFVVALENDLSEAVDITLPPRIHHFGTDEMRQKICPQLFRGEKWTLGWKCVRKIHGSARELSFSMKVNVG